MPILTTLKNALLTPFRRDRLESDLDQELESYLEMLIDEKTAGGMDPAQARREALMELGGAEQVKASVRETQHGAALDAFAKDLQFAMRMMRKSPGFTAIVVITLALGIGANTALFSTINAVLLRNIPFPDPDRLVAANKAYDGVPRGPISRLDYFDFADSAKSVDGLAAFGLSQATFTGEGRPDVVGAMMTSWNFFTVLGVDPVVGRHFLPEEEQPGASGSILISHRLWQRRFGGDANVVGRSVQVNGSSLTIVGVIPAGFRFMYDVDVWGLLERGDFFYDRQRDSHSLRVIGRLKKGVSIEQAQSEFDGIALALQKEYPDTNKGKGIILYDLQRYMVGSARTSLFLLMATTAMVLLIACGNVAGLLLARGQRRLAEMAMRTALGAPRRRLVRQLVTESTLYTLMAGGVGIAVAFAFLRLLLRLLPLGRPGLPEPTIDGAVLLFTLGVSILVGVGVGVVPALRATSYQPWAHLKAATKMTEGRRGTSLRNLLVVVQVAISVALLIGSGLLIRTMANLTSVDLGFDPENLLAGTVTVLNSDYETPQERGAFFTTLVERVRALPGVVAASTVSHLPIASQGTDWPVWRTDQPRPTSGEGRMPYARWTTPGYFETIGIPILRGRDISTTDTADSPKILLVTEAVARDLFPDQDAIGRAVKLGWTDDIYEIIGIVGTARLNDIDSDSDWAMYISAAQMGANYQWVTVRTEGDPMLLEEPIRDILYDLNPNLVLSNVTLMESVVESNLAGFRTVMAALGLLAGVALLLTSVGLYGVLSYHVSQRSNEFGIRLALGAPTSKMLSLVLTRGFRLVVAGLVVGLVGSLLGTRLVEQLLYETDRLDPFSFAGAAAFLAGIALIACIVPAWRAIRISPVEVLRRE